MTISFFSLFFSPFFFFSFFFFLSFFFSLSTPCFPRVQSEGNQSTADDLMMAFSPDCFLQTRLNGQAPFGLMDVLLGQVIAITSSGAKCLHAWVEGKVEHINSSCSTMAKGYHVHLLIPFPKWKSS